MEFARGSGAISDSFRVLTARRGFMALRKYFQKHENLHVVAGVDRRSRRGRATPSGAPVGSKELQLHITRLWLVIHTIDPTVS